MLVGVSVSNLNCLSINQMMDWIWPSYSDYLCFAQIEQSRGGGIVILYCAAAGSITLRGGVSFKVMAVSYSPKIHLFFIHLSLGPCPWSFVLILLFGSC